MKQTSIKTTIPKFILSINFETLKEKNSNPEDWAELLYKIKKYTDVSEEDPYEFFANIDHALFYIIMKVVQMEQLLLLPTLRLVPIR